MSQEYETRIDQTDHAVESVVKIFNSHKGIKRSEINKAIENLSEIDQKIALSKITMFLTEHNQNLKNLPE